MLLQKTINKGSKQTNSIEPSFPKRSLESMNKNTNSSPKDNHKPNIPQMSPRQQPFSLNDYFQQKNPSQFAQSVSSDPDQQLYQSQQSTQKHKISRSEQLITKWQVDRAKQLFESLPRIINKRGNLFIYSDLQRIAKQCGLRIKKVWQIRKQFIKDPTLSQLYLKAQQNKSKNEKCLRLIRYYIDNITGNTPNISMDDLVKEIIRKIPFKYKAKVNIPIVKSVMEDIESNGILGTQSPGFQLINFNTKNTINILQYSKSILRILDQNKLVYFLGTDVVATQKQTTNETQQRKIVMRGVLGSNLVSFWDIFIGAYDSVHQNRSLLNLLTILRKKNESQQIHLAMSRQFMEDHKQALRSVSSLGFIFVDFGEKAKHFNPLKLWFKDIKELANKYDVKTRVKFQESFQYVCSLLDRKNYATYFKTCTKEMRTIVEESDLIEPR